MRALRRFAHGIRALLAGRRADAELDEELRGFIDAAAAAKIRAGLPADRARREARLEMGGVESVKEQVRDAGWERRAGTLAQDVRYGLRVMRRTPLVTAAALVSLALGIGANTAIFSIIDAVRLRVLPVDHPEQLRLLGMRTPSDTDPNPNFTNVLWEDIRRRQDVFSSVFAWGQERFDLTTGGEARYADTILASGSMFSTLGVRPAAGRLLTEADDRPGCGGAAVLSDGFWRDHFGADPDVVGRSLMLDRREFPIVGVVQSGFTGMKVGAKFDVVIPICAAARFEPEPTRLVQRSWWWLYIVGRLKPGISTDQANARLSAMSGAVMDATVPLNWKPEMQKRFKTRLLVSAPAGTGLSGLRRLYAEPLGILLSIAGLVLLIACANIAALMLARASARRKEFGVRLAVGASRGRLVRQLLTESVLLSSLGALGGLFVARWGSAVLVRAISTSRTRLYLDVSPDLRILGFTAAVAISTGLLFGLWPAIRATRTAPADEMKGGGPVRAFLASQYRPGRWIAAAQIALCLTLLATSGLFLRSFVKLVSVDLGFDRTHVLVASMAAQEAAAPNVPPPFDAIQARLQALPGVISVSRSLLSPLGTAQWDNGLNVEGPHASVADTDTLLNYVSPGFFRTLTIPLRAGRDFSTADSAAGASVAIVNEALARKFFGTDRPIGHRFHLDAMRGEAAPSIEIVGIVADTTYNSLREGFPPVAYFPIAQLQGRAAGADFQLRTAGDPLAMSRTVESEVAAVDRAMSLEFHTLDEHLNDAVTQERLLAGLSTFFGVLALLLAGVGLYGVLAYDVAQRQKETGIRLALGAAPGTIVTSVLIDVARLLVAGLVVGAALAAGAARYIRSFLFDLGPNDPATFLFAAAALVVVGLAAAWWPARRAARTDPLLALRRD